ncbi:hypothetical protein [Microbacterium aurantiacum]|uniref:hypothetical protein n=1 Tax=Microbacterium aurantiacum TaxID=162393 RepID=UPI0007DA922A|nr:hypothetical protein [Microbacterium chocolatum]ANG85762.1 hypothetical protein A8L33_10505 [Microbacterium chocolatum]
MNIARERLLSPYRAVRRVGAGIEGPWPGLGVALQDGGRGLLVDAEILGSTWPGWAARDDGHLLSPLDVVRRPDGHDALLPVCRRLDRMLADRVSAGERLPAGEAVTLALSLLRGLREAGDHARLSGSWWVDAGGRPVLAIGDGAGEADARTATRRCLELSGASPADPVWAPVFADLDRSRSSAREIRAVEDGLFAMAEPQPLSHPGTAPRPMTSVRPERDTAGIVEDAPPRMLSSWARFLDADLADLFSRWTTEVWRRTRLPQRSRRLPVVLAGVTGAGVLAAGLLWPAAGAATSGDAPVATTDAVASDAPAGAPQEPAPVTSPPPDGASGAADMPSTADSLIQSRLTCAGDPSCLSGVVLDPLTVFPSGAVDAPSTERRITLLDDLGGVAVLRLDVDGHAPQLIVLALRDGKWLLRDVHDVPQQPEP